MSTEPCIKTFFIFSPDFRILGVHENIFTIGDSPETHWRPIRDPLETDMPDRRLIGDWHTPSETNMPGESNWNVNTFKYSYFYILFAYLYIGIIYGACRFQLGLRWSMSTVEVSNKACRSPMGLRSGMSVSDGSPIGLRWVSVNNNIFVNSNLSSV